MLVKIQKDIKKFYIFINLKIGYVNLLKKIYILNEINFIKKKKK
jgi:hypothetical protein